MARKIQPGHVAAAAFAAVLFVLVVWPLVNIQFNLWKGKQAREVLLEAFRDRYPEADVQVGYSYQAPRSYVSVYGVKDLGEQAEIRDWLAALKADRRLPVQIWLRFYSGRDRLEPSAEFKL